jgi:hypothetical protein
MAGFMRLSQLCCLFCAVLAFAQQPSEEKSFGKLRGFAYNPYGTLGAAPTIADILQKPSDIYGYKFVYIDPVYNSAYSAFDLAGGSALLGFDHSLTLGFAKSFYGLSLNIYPDLTCLNNDGHECTGKYNIGLNFSMPLGNSILYVHAGRVKINNTQEWECDDCLYPFYRYKASEKNAYLGITGGNVLAWDLMLSFYYSYVDAFFNGGASSFKEYNTEFLFNFGYKILQSDRVKFIVGLNNEFFWQQQSSIEGDYAYSHFNADKLYINISPNFLGEVILTKHLIAFVGAKYHIHFQTEFPKDSYFGMDYFSIENSGSGAYTGLRYECENWAVETRLWGDAFEAIFNRHNPFINLVFFIWLAL